MKTNSKKHIQAFTLIELIATVTVIGVLVFMAMPNYLNQKRKADIGIIQKDIMFVESYLGEKKILDPESIESFEDTSIETLDSPIEKGNIYKSDGRVYSIEENTLKVIPKSLYNKNIPIESEGTFLTDVSANVYFINKNK